MHDYYYYSTDGYRWIFLWEWISDGGLINFVHIKESNRGHDGLERTTEEGQTGQAGGQTDGEGEDDDDEDEENSCCVCFERETKVSLPCAHSFCPRCIDEWQLRSNACPLCRYSP